MSDTITAIATPVGEGGVSLIRISGKRALAIASTLFHASSGLEVQDFSPHHVYFGEIRQPGAGQCVDEVLLTWFQGPRSYTAEDVVEISAHGGVFVSSRILGLILDQGARLAEPGEFTRRAFLNGRIDLSQAEAVADVIAASSERALRSAVSQLKGDLSARLNEMYDRLLAVLAQLEAAIDFPEEDLSFQSRDETREGIHILSQALESLIRTYRQGKIFREGVAVALVGKPNVGKSSLLNALLQEDRAIVTSIPGTTRDTLEERVRIKDVHINIVDAAGLRENPDLIEEQGIQRARAALARAGLALAVFDASRPLDANDDLLIREVGNKSRLILMNKTDLPQRMEESELKARFPGEPVLKISATEGMGLPRLFDAIYDFAMGGQRLEEPVIITRERHRRCLAEARDSLEKAGASLEKGLSEEFVAVDVTLALEQIGNLLGKTFGEDLLDRIFGEFCIGK